MNGIDPTPAPPDRTPLFGVAELVHSLYGERGRNEGHRLEDWIEAERRISGKQLRARRSTSEKKRAAAQRARTWAGRRVRILDRNGNGAAR